MTDEVYDLALKEVVKNGIRDVKLYMCGEPLLHKNIIDFIVRGRKAGLTVTISTNGMVVDDSVIADLVRSNINRVQVSYVTDRTAYESVYKGGDFDRVTENFTKLRTALGNRVTVCTNAGIGYTTGIYGVDSWSSKDVNVGVPCPTNPHIRRVCSTLATRIGILYDGRISGCGCIDSEGEFILGSVQDGLDKALIERSKTITRFKTVGMNESDFCFKCENSRHTR